MGDDTRDETRSSRPGERIPAEALRQDVERVVDELDDPPTRAEYDDLGEYSYTTVAERFGDGSWVSALEQFGLRISDRGGWTIPRERLAADVQPCVSELGRPPTKEEYDDIGEHAPDTVAERFGDGSWCDALETLGYDVPDSRTGVSPEQLRADVERVAEELGHPPNTSEYERRGEHSPMAVARAFGRGRWSVALDELGYDPGADSRVEDHSLREAVEKVADELNRPPTTAELDERSRFDHQQVANRFGDGRWLEAIEELGYDVSGRRSSNTIPDSTLREDVNRVVSELGHIPTSTEYDERGRHAAQTIANRFGEGSWTDALEALGLADAEERDVHPNGIADDILREDVRRVIDELGRLPTTTEYDDRGEYSTTTVANRFGGGSWRDALRVVRDDSGNGG